MNVLSLLGQYPIYDEALPAYRSVVCKRCKNLIPLEKFAGFENGWDSAIRAIHSKLVDESNKQGNE